MTETEMRSTLEQMAIETLRGVATGDLSAAMALADCLMNENLGITHTPILPVKRITVPHGRLRIILFATKDAIIEQENMRDMVRMIQEWVTSEEHNVMCLTGIDRMEIYELPESYNVPQPDPPPPYTIPADELARINNEPEADGVYRPAG